jgi:hypothetical protein
MKNFILAAIAAMVCSQFAIADDDSTNTNGSLNGAPATAEQERSHRDATFNEADHATRAKTQARKNRDKTMHKKHSKNSTHENQSFNSGPGHDSPGADTMHQTTY